MSAYDHALFYNSDNGDRVYDADSFEYLLKKFFTTGVFTGDCAVSANSGMVITMASGYCNIGGKVRFFAEAQNFTLATAHATYGRIDAVVIERNDSNREITAKVVTGLASASPVAPTPVRSSGVYQIVVALISVAAGTTAITNSNITDKRTDPDLCGYVCSAVQTPDFSELYSQFTDAFNTWFNAMKGQLTTDAAGNLQTEIDNLGNDYVKHSAAQTLTDAQKLQARTNIGVIPEVLWQNSNPTTGMGYTEITIPQNSYLYYIIEYKRNSSSSFTEFKKISRNGDCYIYQLNVGVTTNTASAYIRSRNIDLNHNPPYIDRAKCARINDDGSIIPDGTADQMNNLMLPVAIYGTNIL